LTSLTFGCPSYNIVLRWFDPFCYFSFITWQTSSIFYAVVWQAKAQ